MRRGAQTHYRWRGSLGFTEEIKGKTYISATTVESATEDEGEPPPSEDGDDSRRKISDGIAPADLDSTPHETPFVPPSVNRRVFITHGKNKAFLDPLKKLLGFGELEPVVAAERQSVSQPVPDKVMSDMRGCGTAIIHVDDEQKLMEL